MPTTLTTKMPLLVMLALSLSACKVVIITPPTGEVIANSGAYRCAPDQRCVIEVSDDTFQDAYFARPKSGWEFVRWKKYDKAFCGGSREACSLSTLGFSHNENLMAVLASDTEFYLEPVFRRLTTEAIPASACFNADLFKPGNSYSFTHYTPPQRLNEFSTSPGIKTVIRVPQIKRHANQPPDGRTRITYTQQMETYAYTVSETGSVDEQFIDRRNIAHDVLVDTRNNSTAVTQLDYDYPDEPNFNSTTTFSPEQVFNSDLEHGERFETQYLRTVTDKNDQIAEQEDVSHTYTYMGVETLALHDVGEVRACRFEWLRETDNHASVSYIWHHVGSGIPLRIGGVTPGTYFETREASINSKSVF